MMLHSLSTGQLSESRQMTRRPLVASVTDFLDAVPTERREKPFSIEGGRTDIRTVGCRAGKSQVPADRPESGGGSFLNTDPTRRSRHHPSIINAAKGGDRGFPKARLMAGLHHQSRASHNSSMCLALRRGGYVALDGSGSKSSETFPRRLCSDDGDKQLRSVDRCAVMSPVVDDQAS